MAEARYRSPDYEKVLPLRLNSTRSTLHNTSQRSPAAVILAFSLFVAPLAGEAQLRAKVPPREFREVVGLRHKSAKTNLVLLGGCEEVAAIHQP